MEHGIRIPISELKLECDTPIAIAFNPQKEFQCFVMFPFEHFFQIRIKPVSPTSRPMDSAVAAVHKDKKKSIYTCGKCGPFSLHSGNSHDRSNGYAELFAVK